VQRLVSVEQRFRGFKEKGFQKMPLVEGCAFVATSL
jgi:hypothetical protein